MINVRKELGELIRDNSDLWKNGGRTLLSGTAAFLTVSSYQPELIRGHEFIGVPPLHTFLSENSWAFSPILAIAGYNLLAGLFELGRSLEPSVPDIRVTSAVRRLLSRPGKNN